MDAKIRNLANLMKLKKDQGDEPYVLLLGAGASLSSGVPTTNTIVTELLAQYDAGNEGGDVLQRFDRLWKRTPDATRRAFLAPYLQRQPSPGYQALAELIEAGYFDLALTFNFDELLETALRTARVDGYRRVVRGETIPEEMQKLLDAKDGRFKIVKLHGSLGSSDYFLFDVNEMFKYPAPIEELVRRVTKRDIIVCGYAFNDLCVMQAFSMSGGSIVCVNPGGVPRNLSVFLRDRRSDGNEILTDFDTFFGALRRELLQPAAAAAASEKPPPNPFKFLESYDEHDKDAFRGRDDEIADFCKFLKWSPPPRVIVITGPSKAGKTSLIRAGLLPQLDPAAHLPVYLRCRADVETQVPGELACRGLVPEGLPLPEALAQLGQASPGRRVILFFDQFERVTGRFKPETRAGKKQLSDFLDAQLFAGSTPEVTIVLSVTDDGNLGATLSQECGRRQLPAGTLVCPTFGREDVAQIMTSLATAAGFEFETGIIEDMADRFESTKSAPSENRFTLAHMHAACHILAGTRQVSYDSYKRAFEMSLEALNQAINVSQFTNFVEDCGWPNSAWFRNMIKVPLKMSKERIAEFIKAHYEELMPRDRAAPAAGRP